jgi:hypothetical protein
MRPRVHVAPKDATTPGVPPCASLQVVAGRQNDIAETALHDCPALLASSPSASIQRLTAAVSCNFDWRESMRVARLSHACRQCPKRADGCQQSGCSLANGQPFRGSVDILARRVCKSSRLRDAHSRQEALHAGLGLAGRGNCAYRLTRVGRGVLELPPSAYLSLVRAFPPRDVQQRRSNGNQSRLHDNKVLSYPATTALALCYNELIRSDSGLIE